MIKEVVLSSGGENGVRKRYEVCIAVATAGAKAYLLNDLDGLDDS